MSKHILEVSPLKNSEGVVGYAPFVRTIEGHDHKTHAGAICSDCVGWTAWIEMAANRLSGAGRIFSTEVEAMEVGQRVMAGSEFA